MRLLRAIRLIGYDVVTFAAAYARSVWERAE